MTLSGTLRDLSGAPVQGARASVGSARAHTDASGRYTLQTPSGTQRIELSADGYQTTWVTRTLQGSMEMDARLTRPGLANLPAGTWPCWPYRPGSYAGRSFYYDSDHLGEDVALAAGARVRSVCDGVIRLYRPAAGYGELVVVVEQDLGQEVSFSNADGEEVLTSTLLWIYGHLRSAAERGGQALSWSVGDRVARGEVIGFVNDDAHNGDGAEHLHLGLRLSSAATAAARDPRGWFRGYEAGTDQGRDYASPREALARLALLRRYGQLGVERMGAIKDSVRWLFDDGDAERDCYVLETQGGDWEAAQLVFDASHGATEAKALHDGFSARWSQAGGPRSQLGMPITEEYQATDRLFGAIVRQDFQGGVLVFEPSADRITQRAHAIACPGARLTGPEFGESYAFSEAFGQHGAAAVLGDPTSVAGPLTPGDPPSQALRSEEDSVLVLNEALRRVFVIRGDFLAEYRAQSQLLGAPVTNPYTDSTGHKGQDFEHAALRATARGVVVGPRSGGGSAGGDTIQDQEAQNAPLPSPEDPVQPPAPMLLPDHSAQPALPPEASLVGAGGGGSGGCSMAPGEGGGLWAFLLLMVIGAAARCRTLELPADSQDRRR